MAGNFDILITGADQHQGVAVIRSLGRRGLKILAVGDRPKSIGFYSKYISDKAVLPPPGEDKQGFTTGVIDLIRKYKIPYIFPVTETSMVALDERRAEVEAGAVMLAVSSETLRLGLDKVEALALAENLGIPVSRTLQAKSVEEAESTAEDWGYPVIFKPRGIATAGAAADLFHFKVHYAHSREQLRSILEPFRGSDVFPLMQEYAHGHHRQLYCFMENGKAHSLYQEHTVRMIPITGGVNTCRLSYEIIPEIAEQSVRLFKAMKWNGFAQTQFKGPGKDGKYRFIEATVRSPASIYGLMVNGIDTPWMQYQLFSGGKVEPVNSYKAGKRNRWLRGDFMTVFRYLIDDVEKSDDKLPSKGAVLGDFLLDFIRCGLRTDTESFTDPLPGFYEFREMVNEARWRYAKGRKK